MNRWASDLPRKLRGIVLNKTSGKCFYCGENANTIDHLIPVSKGGTADAINLVAACAECNTEKGDRTIDEYIRFRLDPARLTTVAEARADFCVPIYIAVDNKPGKSNPLANETEQTSS